MHVLRRKFQAYRAAGLGVDGLRRHHRKRRAVEIDIDHAPRPQFLDQVDRGIQRAGDAGRHQPDGLGPDAHVASLFPGSPQLDDVDHRATSGPPGLEPWVDRVTMTMPEIRTAKRIVFIVDGPSKAEAVARAFGGNISPAAPASLVLLAPISVEVFLDEAAAAKLGNR